MAGNGARGLVSSYFGIAEDEATVLVSFVGALVFIVFGM